MYLIRFYNDRDNNQIIKLTMSFLPRVSDKIGRWIRSLEKLSVST